MNIHYLTWIRNRVGKSEEVISLPPEVRTISDLLDILEQRDDNYKKTFAARSVIFSSINGRLCSHDSAILDSDHVSFFSAIVGG